MPSTTARPAAGRRWLVGVIGLALAASISRLPFRSRFPFNWDAVQYLLGMRHFDIAAHEPHPPGNPLYILLGRAAHLIIPDANQALVVVSILATAAAVVLTAILGRKLASPSVGLWAAALVAANPLFWLYGDVALSYVPEAAAGLVVALAVWTAYEHPSSRSMVFLGVSLAAAGGLRPTVLVLLVPLWLFGLWRASWRERAVAVGVAGFGCLLWLVPLVLVSGGPGAYLTQLRLMSDRVDVETTIGTARLADWVSNVGNVVASLALGVNALALPSIAAVIFRRGRFGRPGARAVFLSLWVLAPLTVFVFFHLGQVGYVLLVLPPLILLCVLALEHVWPAIVVGRRGAPLIAVLVALALACSTFTVPSISAHDRAWAAIAARLDSLPPSQTVLLAATDQAGTFRLAGLLLPQTHALGTGRDEVGTFGVLYEALNGHSTFHLDPALRACQLVHLAGVENLVVTGQSLVAAFVIDATWTRVQLPDGTWMLIRRQTTRGMTVEFSGGTVTVQYGLVDGPGLSCSASPVSPLSSASTGGG